MGVGLFKATSMAMSVLAAISSLAATTLIMSMYSPLNFTLQMYVVDAGLILSGAIALALAIFRRFALSLVLSAIHFSALLILNLA